MDPSATVDPIPVLILKSFASALGLACLVAGFRSGFRPGRSLVNGFLTMLVMLVAGCFFSVWSWCSTITAAIGVVVIIFLLHREKLIPWAWWRLSLKGGS